MKKCLSLLFTLALFSQVATVGVALGAGLLDGTYGPEALYPGDVYSGGSVLAGTLWGDFDLWIFICIGTGTFDVEVAAGSGGDTVLGLLIEYGAGMADFGYGSTAGLSADVAELGVYIAMSGYMACPSGLPADYAVDASFDASEPGPYSGYVLSSSMQNTTSNLIDADGSSVHSWPGTGTAASMPYLMTDGTIVRPSKVTNPSMSGGAVGGRVQKIDWDGNVQWNFTWSDTDHQHHHDIQPMPSGNVLIVSWERKTRAEAVAAGRQSISGEMWPTEIVEVEPVGSTGGNVVWEWHLWDHLIQDADPSKANYGVVADHPELMDINSGSVGGGPGGGDWDHVNSIDYNEELDQILFGSRTMSEFYIIDHSTTTEEAAGHTGGACGKGGDFLYRWGNPRNYDRGSSSDQQIYVIHGVNWIPAGSPGEGNIIYYNNGVGRPGGNYSSAEEVVPPLEPDGNYTLGSGSAFGPDEPTWIYNGGGSFYAQSQSGAFRLPNGNTLISVSTDPTSYLFEVTNDGEVVWDYTAATGNKIARAQKYGLDYLE